MTIEYFKNDKVVALDAASRSTRFSALGTVESYWEGLRDGRLMPTRSDVDPRGIADALEYAFILEKIAPGLARIRLAGMHLNTLMAMEVRGMPVSALFLPEARREIQQVIGTVLDEPAVVRLSLASQRGFRRPALQARMILLPLRDATGRPARILGALQSSAETGETPRRFTIQDIETKPLVSDPLTAPRGWATPKAAPGPADRTVETAHAPRAPHLKLVFDADTV